MFTLTTRTIQRVSLTKGTTYPIGRGVSKLYTSFGSSFLPVSGIAMHALTDGVVRCVDENTEDGGWPSWWPAAVAVLIGLAWPGGRRILADYGIEFIMIALIAGAVLGHPEIKQALRGAPAVAMRAAKLFIAAVLVAQLVGLADEAWPFTDWTMYTVAPPQVVRTYEIDGLTAEGEPVDFLPSFDNRTLSTKMPHLLLRNKAELVHRLRLESGDTAALAEATKDLSLALVEIAALHNDQNPNERVATVVITRLGFTLEEERMGAIQRDEVLQVQIEAP